MTPERRIHARISASAPSGWLLNDLLAIILMCRVVEAARDVADAGRTEIEDSAVLHALAGALTDLDSTQSTQDQNFGEQEER